MKQDLLNYANSLSNWVDDCEITSVLPSALFVKNQNGKTYSISSPVLTKTDVFKTGQHVRVIHKNGKPTQVILG